VTTTAHHPARAWAYHLILGAASGFAVGCFAWFTVGETNPLWPYAAAGVVLMIAAVRFLAVRRGTRRRIHLLWIPVVLFLALMAAVVLALRNFT
jgi:uncharacterized membrane protein